jgi:NAD(P)-dependent dehydrogenase (short-subunit alcohol dehydrogenase family)
MSDPIRGPIFVTGGAHGIGCAVARRLGREGMHVGVADVDRSAAVGVAAEIQDAGGHATPLDCDVTDADAIQHALARLESEAEAPVAGAVLCAGVSAEHPFLEHPLAVWDAVIAVNLTGTFLAIQAVGRSMAASRTSGAIVALSSVSARGGRPTQAAYAASKAGILSVVRSAALTLAPYAVSVNAICPGVVDTDMTHAIHARRAEMQGISSEQSLAEMVARIPMGRMETPDEVAGIISFLLSPAARYITGQGINACGGLEFS